MYQRYLCIFILFGFSLYAASLSERLTQNLQDIADVNAIGYSLKKGEVVVVKRDGKYYKRFDTEPFSGRAIIVNKHGIVRFYLSLGVKDGYYLMFNNQGNLVKEANYKNGILNGTLTLWDENNEKKVSQIEYKDNVPCEGWYKNSAKNLTYKDCKKSGQEILKVGNKVYKYIYKDNEIIEKIELK